AANSSEVEGCNRQYKSFQRTIFHAVVHTRTADGLLPVDLRKKMHIETEKIYNLTGAVNFCLEGVLALPQHGSAVHIGAVFRSNQIGSFKKNIRAVFPAQRGPLFTRAERSIN